MHSTFVAALLLLTPLVLSALSQDKGKDSDHDITVKPGGCIQDAINKAKKGDKITVEAGNYTEHLIITTDGIQLIGNGAVLLPPARYTPNFCTSLSQTFPPESLDTDAEHKKILNPGNYIKDVVVTGFTVSNFNGENIVVTGGKDPKVTKNKLVNGGQYGFLTVGSIDTLATQSVVTSTTPTFIAMGMDDKADPEFIENDISNYFIAICTPNSGGLVKRNTVKNCCIGPYVDPGIEGAKIIENIISGRGEGCPEEAGAGIVVSGASNTIVEGNTFEGIKNGGNGVGVYVENAASGAKAVGNVFKKNTLKNNDVDIVDATNGTDHSFKKNDCGSLQKSSPAGLCST
ncbi:pectin lyase-like protein [Setomelanomma holmii]|uniref:Pectin lyase-like protein n=1 Tax=Setomelanomma holmii TaxID=210430 RepID=A0A9P4HM07_9PLEO|nr:pectin lyase-like protein [Setomelanomma holmii]